MSNSDAFFLPGVSFFKDFRPWSATWTAAGVKFGGVSSFPTFSENLTGGSKQTLHEPAKLT